MLELDSSVLELDSSVLELVGTLSELDSSEFAELSESGLDCSVTSLEELSSLELEFKLESELNVGSVSSEFGFVVLDESPHAENNIAKMAAEIRIRFIVSSFTKNTINFRKLERL